MFNHSTWLMLIIEVPIPFLRGKIPVMHIIQTASRRYLLSCVLSAILFTACLQPAGAAPTRYSLPHALVQTATWVGYLARGNQGSYTQAGMYFQVPKLIPPSGRPTIVSTWIGLGGSQGGVQVG